MFLYAVIGARVHKCNTWPTLAIQENKKTISYGNGQGNGKEYTNSTNSKKHEKQNDSARFCLGNCLCWVCSKASRVLGCVWKPRGDGCSISINIFFKRRKHDVLKVNNIYSPKLVMSLRYVSRVISFLLVYELFS